MRQENRKIPVVGGKQMSEIIRYAKKLFLRLLLLPMRILPIKKKRILLINNLSQNYSDNPKYIAEFFLEHYPGQFQLIFSADPPRERETAVAREIRFVQFNSLKYFYYAMTSNVLVTNSGGLSYIPLRRRQYVINTGHGGGAYKKVGRHMFNSSFLFQKDLLLAAKQSNVFLSTNRKYTEVISDSLLIPKRIFWEIGMPRNDLLIKGSETVRTRVRADLGLRDGEKLLLFAPTYRKPEDNYFKQSIAVSYGVDAERVCRALKQRFGGDWKFAIRLHPRVVNRQNAVAEGMIDLTDYEDMQELLLAADAMINDFSSSMWDFMLTGRPSFLFALDLQHYVETTEVYTPVSEWPFPKSVNNDELERNILNFNAEEYSASCRRHYEALGGCETGEAAKLVCGRIDQVCHGGGVTSA